MISALEQYLDTINRDVLARWVKKLGLSKSVERKAVLIEHISRCVRNDLAALVARLSTEEKHLLAEAAHHHGEIEVESFRAKYGESCPLPSGCCSYQDRNVSLLLPLIDVHAPEGPKLIAEFVAPLKRLLDKPAPTSIQTVTELPKQCTGEGADPRPWFTYESERIAPAELVRLLRLTHAGKIKVADKSKRPTDATARAIAGTLVVPDFDIEQHDEKKNKWYQAAGPVRAHAWPVLLQQCGWAKARGEQLALTAAGQGLLQRFDPAEYRRGIERFLYNDDFDEMNRIPNIRGQSGAAKRYMSLASERRAAITSAMREWPVNQWIKFDEAYRHVFASGHSFDVVSEGLYLYFCERQYGQLSGETVGINRQYLRALLGESLVTLGLVDIVYSYPHGLWPELSGGWGTDDLWFCSRYDGLECLRLNPLGAYLLGATDSYMSPETKREPLFQILPNHELAVMSTQPLAASDRAYLELFAVPKSDRVWTLDARRMLDHVEAGGALSEIVQFLEHHSAHGIPEPVRVHLSSLATRASTVKSAQEAVLVEFDDATVAALIANDSATRHLCVQAGSNGVVVPKRQQRAFATALKKLGYILPPTGVPASAPSPASAPQ